MILKVDVVIQLLYAIWCATDVRCYLMIHDVVFMKVATLAGWIRSLGTLLVGPQTEITRIIIIQSKQAVQVIKPHVTLSYWHILHYQVLLIRVKATVLSFSLLGYPFCDLFEWPLPRDSSLSGHFWQKFIVKKLPRGAAFFEDSPCQVILYWNAVYPESVLSDTLLWLYW